MSGAPGIVYQTSRSIRSIHCRQFFFKFENLGEALHSFTRSKSSKFHGLAFPLNFPLNFPVAFPVNHGLAFPLSPNPRVPFSFSIQV